MSMSFISYRCLSPIFYRACSFWAAESDYTFDDACGNSTSARSARDRNSTNILRKWSQIQKHLHFTCCLLQLRSGESSSAFITFCTSMYHWWMKKWSTTQISPVILRACQTEKNQILHVTQIWSHKSGRPEIYHLKKWKK